MNLCVFAAIATSNWLGARCVAEPEAGKKVGCLLRQASTLVQKYGKLAFMKFFQFIVCWVVVWFAVPGFAAAPSDVGIVLLHGKGGSPNFHILEKFVFKMEDKGYAVVAPKLPWGGSKGKADYSGDLTDAFGTLDTEIEKLKAAGRKTIVLVGHSMGVPAAMAYAGVHPDVAGVVGVAPGHLVGSRFHDKFVYFDVRKARELVSRGARDEPVSVEDYNSGNRRFQLNVRAKDYLSFFDPEGPFNFESLIRSIGGVPFLWIAPGADPVTTSGQASAYFSKAPKNAKSKFVEVEAEHINAPVKGIKDIHAWLSEL